MKIPISLTEEQRWTIVDIEAATWAAMRNNPTDIQDLSKLKKFCMEFLSYPVIQALTGETDDTV